MTSRPRFAHAISMAVIVLLSNTSVSCRAFQTAPSMATASATVWNWYKSILASQPLLTKSLTSGCIMSISDIMCQELVNARSVENRERKKDKMSSNNRLDLHRTAQVAVTGMVWSGPITHFWYALLENIYAFLSQLLNIQHPVAGLCVKLLLDAILFSPTVVAGYFIVRTILEGGNWPQAKDKLRTKFKPTLIGAWKFWPAVNSVNFYFVPLQFRVLYMNILSLLWSGYLTYVNSAHPPPETKRQ